MPSPAGSAAGSCDPPMTVCARVAQASVQLFRETRCSRAKFQARRLKYQQVATRTTAGRLRCGADVYGGLMARGNEDLKQKFRPAESDLDREVDEALAGI